MKLRFLSSMCLVLVSSLSSKAGIWFVNHAATGTQTGTSWTNAFTDLQTALAGAFAGDTILVAKGTYYPTAAADGTSTNDRDKAFVLKNGLKIFGGFAGTESGLAARLNDSLSLHVTNATILSGDLGTLNDSTDNAYHVVITSAIAGFALDGLSVKWGNADGASPLIINGRTIYRHYAGGIYNDSSSGTFNHVIVANNVVHSFDDEEGGGAGMFNYKGSHIITNTFFGYNRSDNANGGAMKNIASSPNVTDCKFLHNSSFTTDEGGGAVNNRDSSNGVFTNVVFDNNYTNASGGAVYNDGSSPHFISVSFNNNTALNCGGAVDADGGSSVVLNDVSFANNYAAEDGGGFYAWKSSASLTNVTFINNRADNNGGGMYHYNTCNPVITNAVLQNNSAGNDYGGMGLERNSVGVVTNSLFSHNRAANRGGAIGAHDNHSTNATLILTNVTIANNSALYGGGGYDYGTTSSIRNSIIAGNYPDDVDVSISLATNARNLIVGDGTSTTFILDGSVNPLGTPVYWPFFVDTLNSNYRLIAGSDAIDVGDSTFYNTGKTPDLSSITTDLRGADRTMGNNTDLGAFEFCSLTSTPAVSVAASPGTSVPAGATVVFTATLTNAGTSPDVQWWKNSVAITGMNNLTFTAIAGTDFVDADTIWASMRSSEPCADPDSAISNKVVMFIPTGIPSLSSRNAGFELNPNPNNGTFVVRGQFDDNATYHFYITDLMGRKLFQSNSKALNKEVPVSLAQQLPQGIYFITLFSDRSNSQTIRFMVK